MRMCKPDYFNDHIWELEIGCGEPAAFTVRTTYGLRARNMRLFYRFTEAGQAMMNPAAFVRAPRLRRFYPNFLWLDFVPVEGLEVVAEYWVPESHVLAGRATLSNRTPNHRKLDFELCCALTPLDGRSLSFTQQQMVNVLAGRTGGLSPVLFMTGGPNPGPGPHPSLALKLDFEPGTTRTVTWCMAAEGTPEASFELARRTAARPWDAERTRIELMDARDVLDIRTGDPDWDTAFALSQRAALASFYPPTEHLPRASFVTSRDPDAGYSHSGTGMDHPAGWNGQTPLESYYVSSLLPVANELKRGLVENFLHVQAEDGAIDGKPGLGGQKAKYLAAPILAALAWSVYEESGDEAFLQEVFPKLFAFFERWFASDRDTDADGIPTWSHVLQTGFEENPLFDAWHPWSQAVPIEEVFNPELEALLYREATALIRMAEKLERPLEIGKLHERAAVLRLSVESGWNADKGAYSYRDRVTELSTPRALIARRKGFGEMRPRKAQFEQPVRLLIEVLTEEPGIRRPSVDISGKGLAQPGAPLADARQREHIEADQFRWRSGGLTAITRLAYCKVNFVTVTGLEPEDMVVVRTLDTSEQDITLFTPLWAHIPEEARAGAIVRSALSEGSPFHGAFGFRALASLPDPKAEDAMMSVHLPWNQLIIEGLLSYGYRSEAARLTEQLMQATIYCLKHDRGFFDRYHADTGSGIGERGSLAGAAPVGLFLQALGVRILSPTCVHLEGSNPFPWPVTLVHKGLKVIRGLEETEVVFPTGQVVKITDEAPCLVAV
ncbi:MAG: MGH1-like glycoside hydrolase domain-containing protein [Anaerolineae bacterium]